MTINKITFPGQPLPEWVANWAQNPGQNFPAPAGSYGSGASLRFDYPTPVALAAGQQLLLPQGQYVISTGPYTMLQVKDGNNGLWRNWGSMQAETPTWVSSDGTNFRIINLTGCPVGARITNGGTQYTNGYYAAGNATYTVTPGAGGSTWNMWVGGAVNSTVTITAGGSGYTLAPALVWQPAANQTYPFVPPTFTCTISAGAVNAVTCVNQGAGLVAPGSITVINQVGDTTGSGAVLTLNATLAGSGNVTALAMATPGTAQTSVPSLTITASSGTQATATAIMCFTITSVAVGGAGSGLTNATYPLLIAGALTVGAQSNNVVNPQLDNGIYVPRMGHGTAVISAGGLSSVAFSDGGLYQTVPVAMLAYLGAFTTAATVTVNVGGVSDMSIIAGV